jgi:hypothetical protein
MLAELEGKRDGAAHLLKGFLGDGGFQRPLKFLPGIGVAGEKCLGSVDD